MPYINFTNIVSTWRHFQYIIKFTRIYFHYIKFTILISFIIVTMLLQPFHTSQLGNHEKKIRNLIAPFFSFHPVCLIFVLLIGFIVKQILNSTLFQNTVIFYTMLLRSLEILPLYYLYEYIYTDLSRFDSISKNGFILYSILASLKFSNQITIYIPIRFISQYRIQQIKICMEYCLQFFLLWKSGYTRYDLLIILNRLLIVMLYSNLTELLSNEILWKKFISFIKFKQNESKQVHRITKHQLYLLFPSINIAYEILIIRSIIISIIFYNIHNLIEFSIENSLFIQLIRFLIVLLIILDCFLLFYHTNIFGLFWFYTGLNQWNNITEIDIDVYESSHLYSIYLRFNHFIDEYCLKIIRNIFFQRSSHSEDNTLVDVMEPMITTDQNNEEEENSIPSTDRIILDLYQKDGRTPRIHLVGDDIDIQPDDVLVGFVGPTGQGKSHLLRCLTGNEIFKSGNRPTTYMATGTLCTFDQNHRYWIIDTPGDSQATEPERNYFYKKWLNVDSSYDLSLDHRINEENGYKYEEKKLTKAVVSKYIDDLLQILHLCVFVFDTRANQLLKDYYNDHIIRHLGTRFRVIFARTKWDSMHVNTIEARNQFEEDERKLLIETFQLDPTNRVRIVFTTGLIDNESNNDPDIMKSIREKGFTIDNLKQMIIETTNDHWKDLQIENEAIAQGLPLRLSELKEGDHILYFPTLQTKKPYSALIALNQNGNIQVYARTAKFINNQRQHNSSGTEYHYFSFDDFRRSTFEEVDQTVPNDYVQDPLLIIRQLYKNSTETERNRTNAILRHHPEFKANICDINSDGPSRTLARAQSILRNTNYNDNVTFQPDLTADFVYTCKTGRQPPLDANFWTTYNLSSVSDLTGYGVRALSYFTHLTVDGTTKSLCRTIGRYPVIDVVMCAINCYQEPHNKGHHISKAAVGGLASTVVCIAATSLTGPFAPVVLYGGMIAGGEIGNYLGGKLFRWKPHRNERALMLNEEDFDQP